jgi:hypothetical protein
MTATGAVSSPVSFPDHRVRVVGSDSGRWLLEVQDGLEGEVDAPLLLDGEVALVVTEPADVDGASLFHQHSSC